MHELKVRLLKWDVALGAIAAALPEYILSATRLNLAYAESSRVSTEANRVCMKNNATLAEKYEAETALAKSELEPPAWDVAVTGEDELPVGVA